MFVCSGRLIRSQTTFGVELGPVSIVFDVHSSDLEIEEAVAVVWMADIRDGLLHLLLIFLILTMMLEISDEEDVEEVFCLDTMTVSGHLHKMREKSHLIFLYI